MSGYAVPNDDADGAAANLPRRAEADGSRPVFTSGARATTVENKPSSTVVYTAKAKDTDSGGPNDAIRYSLSGADAKRFTIDAESGQVRFKASPDYEAPADANKNNVYKITVIATDKGDPGKSVSKTVSIKVTDENDNRPVFTSGGQATTVENKSSSTVVYTAKAKDADSGGGNDTIRYSLSGADAKRFTIDAESGQVRFKASPDYEAPADANKNNVYKITVIATDKGDPGKSVSKTVSIKVTDENDNRPVFTSGGQATTVENTLPATVVYTAKAQDADAGSPNNAVRYSLSGADAGLFTIDSVTGEVRFATAPDYEAPADADRDNVYSVTVTATDAGNPALATQNAVSIAVGDANDNSPVFTSATTSATVENTLPATVVYTAKAQDADAGSPNNAVRYSLSGADAGLFTIDPVTGEVRFTTAPNYEAPADADRNNVYTVTVTATDSGNPALATQNTVSIAVGDTNDNPPVFTSAATSATVENTLPATVVYTAKAQDADAGSPNNAVRYSLSGADAGLFTIDPVTGEVRFTTAPNYEAPADAGRDNVYTVTVAATDAGNPALATQNAVSIVVGNVNEAPTVKAPLTAASATDKAAFTVNLLEGATDVDIGDLLSVRDLGGLVAGLSLNGNALAIDPAAFASLGAGEVRTIPLTYKVVDKAGAATSQTLTVTITGVDDPGGDVAPAIIGYADDSGNAGDARTNDATPTLRGIAGAGDLVTIQVDGVDKGSVVAGQDGTWSYSASALSDGVHQFTASSAGGRSGPYALTIDTAAPNLVSAGLARASDTGVGGDGRTSAETVSITGVAEAGARVEIGGLATVAGTDGAFTLANVALALGDNELAVRVLDAAGNATTSTLAVERYVSGTNTVLEWNKIALSSVATDGDIPVEATRMLAMASIAAYDVINAVDGAPALLVALTPPEGVSVDAAVAAAMAGVLTYSYPAQTAALQAKLSATIAGLGLDAGTAAASLRFGQDIAEAVVAIRDSDGWDGFDAYTGSDDPGLWRPTGPAFETAEAPQWADLDPFLIESGDQFRAGPPPALDSARYAQEYNQVKELGAYNSTVRTADQTQIARFWADGIGSYTPGGHWDAIANSVAVSEGLSLGDSAKLFATLNIALADAGVAGWDTKYTYNSWRPITAIHAGDADGNDATVADPDWQPLAITPSHPDYVSGHSTFSGAAAAVLTAAFGDDYAFSTTSVTAPGITRSFGSFEDAAIEAGLSRIYGGIHTQSANEAGHTIGNQVAAYVLESFGTGADTRAPTIVVPDADGSVSKAAPILNGFALDNLPGLSSLRASLDGGAATSVAVGNGRFTLDVADLFGTLAQGAHVLRLAATDAAGNEGATTFTFTVDALAPVLQAGLANGATELAAGARLAGTVDGTGSTITALSYAIDGGTARPLSFDARTGAFDAALDLKTLGVGAHTITVTATDEAGNSTIRTIETSLPAQVPFAVAAITPKDGAGDIGATFRPDVTFTRPVDPATVTADSFYATDASGAKLPAGIVVTPDGLRAYLLFEGPMPGASRVEIHLDGALVKAAGDGQALDGDGNGTPGGTLLSDFTTVSLSVVPGTTITGIVVGPGADLKPMTFDDFRVGPDQAANTADDVYLEKIAGARVWVLGQEDNFVITNADGSFTLEGVPTGNVKLAIDGRTATNAPEGFFFPEMVMDLTIRPGVANTVMGSMGSVESQLANLDLPQVYLPRILTASLTPISDDAATTVTVPTQGTTGLTLEQQSLIKLVVAPGSLVDEHGQPVEAPTVGVSTVPPALVRDMLPPGLMQHTFDLTIQAPDAALFTTPAQLTLPNVFNAPPGTKLNLLSFDHTTGRLVIDGTGTVSADGLSVVTDPGQGVTMPGWHGMTTAGSNTTAPPPPPNNPPPPCGTPNIGNVAKVAFNSAMDGVGFATNLVNSMADMRVAYWVGFTIGSDIVNLISEPNDWKNWVSVALDVAQFIPITAPAARVLSLGFGAYKLYVDKQQIEEAQKKYADAMKCYIDQATGEMRMAASLAADGPNDSVALLEFKTKLEDLAELLEIFPEIIKKIDGEKEFGGLSEAEFRTMQDGLISISNLGPDIDSVIEIARSYITAEQKLIAEMVDIQAEAVAITTADAGNIGLPPRASNHIFLAFESQSGDIVRIMQEKGQDSQIFLAENTYYTLTAFDPFTRETGSIGFKTNESGAPTFIPSYFMFQDEETTIDGILSETAAYVVGTKFGNSDSDGDGITDLTELQNGTNPLGNVPIATGIVASLALDGTANDIVTLSDFSDVASLALIATGSAGLAIVDTSKPLSPRLLATLALDGTATQVVADRQLGLVAVATGIAVALVDISDPEAPALVRTIEVTAADLEVLDGTLLVAAGNAVRAFDMTTGEETQAVSLGGGTVVGLAREGDTLVALDSNGFVTVFAISGDLLIPRGTVSLGFYASGEGASEIYLADGILYVPATDGFQGGFGTVDVSDPANPVVLSGPDDTSLAGSAIALNGSGRGVLVGNPGGAFGANVLDVVDTGDGADTGGFVTRITLPNAPNAVVIDRGFALVADGDGGLLVVNYLPLDTRGQAPTVSVDVAGLDIDPLTAGIQVLEGSILRLDAAVADDVQARDVAVLVDGVATDSDGAFPFDLSVAVPTLATGAANTLSLQVRATDTGGNVGLSETITVQVVEDTIGPSLIASTLADGATVGQTFRTVRLSFSEALDQDAVDADAFQVLDADGTAHAPTAVLFKDGGRTVQLTFDTFSIGAHTLRVDESAILDRAGNPLGVGAIDTAFSVATFTVSWIGETGGDWNDPANWSTGIVPGETDEVFIDVLGGATITIGGAPVTVARLVSLDTIVIENGTTLTLSAGGDLSALDIGYGGFVTDGALRVDGLTLSGGTLSGAGAVTVDELFTWAGGTLSGTGDVTVGAAATLDMGYDGGGWTYHYLQKDLVLQGEGTLDQGSFYLGIATYDVATGQYVNTANSLTVAAGATLTLSGEESDLYDQTVSYGTGPRSSVVNAGTLVRSGEGTSTITVPFENTGTVRLESGTLDLSGGGTGDGSLDVAGAGTLTFGGGDFVLGDGLEITADGTLRITSGTVTIDEDLAVARIEVAGGTLVVNGALSATAVALTSGTLQVSGTLTATTVDLNYGTLEVGGTLSADAVGVGYGGTLVANGTLSVDDLTVSDGTLSGAGAVTVDESFVWTGGTLSGTGDVTIGAAATLDIGNGGGGFYNYLRKDVVLQGQGTLDRGYLYLGTHTYDDATGQYINMANSLTVAAGATLTLSGEESDLYDQTLSSGTGPRSSLVNAGTLLRTGEGTSTITSAFENTGTVTLESGTLELTGGGTGDGGFDVAGAGTLTFAGGDFALGDGLEITADGTLRITSGTVTIDEDLAVARIEVAGGTLVVNGALSVDELVVSGGTLAGTGAVTVDEAFIWAGGTLSGAGDVTVGANATLDIGNGGGGWTYHYLQKDLVLQGQGTLDQGSFYLGIATYDVATGQYVNTASSLTVAAGATLTLSGEDSDLYDQTVSGGTGPRSSFVNAGTLVRTGEGTSTIATSFENTGTVRLESGTLELTGGGTGDGGFDVAGASTLTFAGGDFALGDGLEITADGTLRITSGTVTIDEDLAVARIEVAGGTLVVNGALSATAVALTSGTLQVSGALTATTVDLTYGTLEVGGTLSADAIGVGYAGTLVANGALSVDDLTVSSGTLSGAGAVTVDESFIWTGGTLSGTGDVTVGAAATLDMSSTDGGWTSHTLRKDLVLQGQGTLDQGSLYLGTHTYDDATGQYVNTAGSLTVAAGATLTLSGEQSDMSDQTTSSGTGPRSSLVNAGTLVRTGEGTSTITTSFANTGTVTLESGTLELTGGGTGDGGFDVAGAGTLTFAGGDFALGDGLEITADGTLRITSGTVTIDEDLAVARIEVAGGTLVVNGALSATTVALTSGTLVANGALSVDDLTVSSGTLSGAGAVTVDESFVWTGGTLSGTGDVTVDADATLDMGYDGGGSYHHYLQKDLVLQGEGTLDQGSLYLGTYTYDDATGQYVNTAGSLTVAAGATLTLSGEDSDISDQTTSSGTGPRSSFVNAGTLVRTGEGTSTITVPFENTGTVRLESGALDLSGGGTGDGGFDVAGASTLTFAGGDYALGEGLEITGDGTLRITSGTVTIDEALATARIEVAGGTLVVNGALSVDELTVSGGTLSGTGAVTVDESFVWNGGTLSGTGDVTVDADATLDMGYDGGGWTYHYLQKDLVLQGEGTLDQGYFYLGSSTYDDATGQYVNTAGSLTVAAGATLTLSGEESDLYDQTVSGGTGPRSSFVNAGTLVRTGEGTSTIDDALVTTLQGTVQVIQGSLDVEWDVVL